jgi:hypothetical protein
MSRLYDELKRCRGYEVWPGLVSIEDEKDEKK